MIHRMPSSEKLLFSVILPTFNRARMAAAAVLSVLRQTDPDFELIVVNDGSTDDTRRVLDALPKDPRVTLLHQERNKGQHVCRNIAIRRAKGQFVTFLDSDDLYLPNRLALFRQAVESRPETGFWFSNAYVRRFDRIIGLLFDAERDIPEGKVPGYYAVGDQHLPYVTTNVAIRREAFAKHGYYREDLKILEDTELYSRMLGGGLRVGVIREPLSVRRIHETQITGDYERDFTESLLALAAGNPPQDVAKRRRRELAVEVATYLWKGLRPGDARTYLNQELGEEASSHPLYWKTYLPRPVLWALKSGRGLYVRLKYGALFAPEDFRTAEKMIEPCLEGAEKL
jgi:glycosyltransferase involved in cell wall biosynthesis